MGDSDEEVGDRGGRNRDKFRRERSDYGERSRRRERSWREDGGYDRKRNRDDMEEDRERRRREWTPPALKRMRREGPGWDSFPPPYGRGPWMHPDMPPPAARPAGGYGGDGGAALAGRRRAMLSFKQFLSQQDDSIDDQEAISKYGQYKVDFQRKQIVDFFEDHKEDDWFVCKYHPKSVQKHQEEESACLKARMAAFHFIWQAGRLGGVPLDGDSACSEIVRLMDTAVIKMEGGSDHDLLSLEQALPAVTGKEEGEGRGKGGDVKPPSKEVPTSDETEKPSFMTSQPTVEEERLAQQAREYQQQMATDKKGSKRAKKQQDLYSYEEDSDASSSPEESEHEEMEEPPPPGMGDDLLLAGASDAADGAGVPTLPDTGQAAAPEEKGMGAVQPASPLPPPRPLHVTHSIYIRHIPVSLSSEAIVEVCRASPGFLRVAFADPVAEKGYERRGWLTYSSEVDIKDVCARLSVTKLKKDQQLNCIVNRELSRRVKMAPSVVWAEKIVTSDLSCACELAKALDGRKGLWKGTDEDNPVLQFPPSLLVESEPAAVERGGDEEEGAISDPGTELLDNTAPKVKALDVLLWYLRIVHSVDFYNATHFSSEDNMPHRCGIVTARPPKAQGISQEQIDKHLEEFRSKYKQLLDTGKSLSDDEMEKFGKKDAETEVEQFVEVNTQKLSENKYLCPLSGKKFKGPEFVRKHIFNKHVEKISDVKQEVEFFNNYLRDSERPMPTAQPAIDEPPMIGPPVGKSGPLPPSRAPWNQPRDVMFGRGGWPVEVAGMGGFHGPGMFPRKVPFHQPRGGRRGRRRIPVEYHDLDVPEEVY